MSLFAFEPLVFNLENACIAFFCLNFYLPEAELVEELDVLEDVVVGGAGVAVLVVVAVDQQLDDGFRRVGGDQRLERRRRKGQGIDGEMILGY